MPDIKTKTQDPVAIEVTVRSIGRILPRDGSGHQEPKGRAISFTITQTMPHHLLLFGPAVATMSTNLANRIARDVSHTHKWCCDFCPRLATETVMAILPSTHLSPPRLYLFAHHLCDGRDSSRCRKKLKQDHDRQVQGLGVGPKHLPSLRGPRPFPPSAACAGCRAYNTVDMNMKKCGRCQLVVYCSPECQKDDWPRHKQNCVLIKSVKEEAEDEGELELEDESEDEFENPGHPQPAEKSLNDLD